MILQAKHAKAKQKWTVGDMLIASAVCTIHVGALQAPQALKFLYFLNFWLLIDIQIFKAS